jgi:multiple sugar transport system permease protein
MSVAAARDRRREGTMSVAAAPGRQRGRRRRHGIAPYLFIGPFLVTFAAVLIAPLGYALYLSLYRSRLVGGTVFVGLENYLDAFKDEHLREGITRMAAFFVLQVPIMLLLSLLFALALDSGVLWLSRVIRLGIFVPYAVPSVVAALMWGYLYGPDFGPFAQLARGLGLPIPRFLSSDWMLGSLANIVSWEYIGYNMIILYAALRTVPPELYDAAAVDGAGQWSTAWHIKLPAIRSALTLTGLFSVIGTFQLFNEPRIMSGVAPTVISSDYTPNIYAYALAFTNRQINYSAAVSFVLGFVILVCSYLFIFAATRRRSS